MVTVRLDTNKLDSALIPVKCQIFYLGGVLAIIVLNLIMYTTTQEFSFVGVERKNTTNSEEESTDTVDSFLLSTLSSHLEESFSNSSELSHLYTSDSPIFFNATTPQYKAFNWLVKSDNFKDPKSGWIDPADNPTILQRYILAVLFFATEGEYNYNIGKMFTPTNNKVRCNSCMYNFETTFLSIEIPTPKSKSNEFCFKVRNMVNLWNTQLPVKLT